jgi:anaerobic ribonucleoside-triphosphate reductase activating protein
MAVFTQGCPHRCQGCHNPRTHSLEGGFGAASDEILERFDDNPLLAGITLSGGEPLLQPDALLPLARQVKKRNKSVWCYTGYTFEEIRKRTRSVPALEALLRHIAVLVDGRYDAALRGLGFRFRGSSNQRLVDVPQSLKSGRTVLWETGGRVQE